MPTATAGKVELNVIVCRLIAHDDGAAVRTGSNGGVDGVVGNKANSGVRSLVGLFNIFNNAVVTSAGAAPPEGVESVNSLPQFDPSPATPPVVFTHDEIMPASVLINVLGTASPAGIEPGEVPVAVFAYSEASVNAAVSPDASDAPDPMQVGADVQAGEVIYGESAATAATVVTSFRSMAVVEVSELHDPRAAIRVIAVLSVPSPRPGLPPVASR
jgi:hypothetical protein